MAAVRLPGAAGRTEKERPGQDPSDGSLSHLWTQPRAGAGPGGLTGVPAFPGLRERGAGSPGDKP